MIIWQNNLLRIEPEPSEIPWVKVFVNRAVKELSECTENEKIALFACMDITEKVMLEYYSPAKINIASFGNMLPQVHVHIMARFECDSYFPQPMWGEVQREATLDLPDEEGFRALLIKRLES